VIKDASKDPQIVELLVKIGAYPDYRVRRLLRNSGRNNIIEIVPSPKRSA